ncbi:MAG TPA: DUF58 domain-containing protein [Galbitalea sp.]
MTRAPRASQPKADKTHRRRSARLTVRGFSFVAAGAACGVLAYVVGRGEFLYPAALLIVLPLIGYFVVRIRSLRLSVVRTFSPPVVTAGTPTVIELSVRNEASFTSAPATWSDHIPWFPHEAGPGVLPPLPAGTTIGPTRSTRLGYSLRPSLRGVYDIGPLTVTYTDPFGLAVGRLEAGGSQSLYVIPLVVPLSQTVSLSVSGEGSARLIQHMATGNDDDLMTREYRTGDALRRVHWRASARHGELMVRQEEQRSYPEARLILDTRADGYGGNIASFEFSESGFTWFEWAITMIASLGVHLHRSGFLVQILETGPKQIAALGDANQGSGQDLEFLLSLAGVRVEDASPVIGEANDDRAQGALGPVFAIVAAPSPETLRWIIAQRRPYEMGIAFVLDTGEPGALRQLADAGWICVPVTDTSDPAQVWGAVSRYTAQTVLEGR